MVLDLARAPRAQALLGVSLGDVSDELPQARPEALIEAYVAFQNELLEHVFAGTVEGQPACRQLVGDDAQRVPVGGLVVLALEDHFGGVVGERAASRAR